MESAAGRRVGLTRLLGLQLAVVVAAAVATGGAVTVAMILAGTATSGAVLYGAALALIGVGAAAWVDWRGSWSVIGGGRVCWRRLGSAPGCSPGWSPTVPRR